MFLSLCSHLDPAKTCSHVFIEMKLKAVEKLHTLSRAENCRIDKPARTANSFPLNLP